MKNFLHTFAIAIFSALCFGEDLSSLRYVPVKCGIPVVEDMPKDSKISGIKSSVSTYQFFVYTTYYPKDYRLVLNIPPLSVPVRWSPVPVSMINSYVKSLYTVNANTISARGERFNNVIGFQPVPKWDEAYDELHYWNVMSIAQHQTFDSALRRGGNYFISQKCKLLEAYERKKSGNKDWSMVILEVVQKPHPHVWIEVSRKYQSCESNSDFVPSDEEIYNLKMDILFTRLALEYIKDRMPLSIIHHQ